MIDDRHGNRSTVVTSQLPIEVTAKIDRLIEREGLDLPPGYRLETDGDSEEQGKAVALLLAYAPLLGALMLASLVLAFRSLPLAGIVGLVAVLSAGLGMLSLWLAGFPLGSNPLLGSAGLVGVAINASIVVLVAIRADLDAAAGQVNAIVDAVVESSRHIASTTLTTVGGFLPLLLFSGGDFWPPLGVVIAGGVGFSIILGLLLTPALYRLAVAIRVVSPRTAGHVAGNMAADATGARA